MLDLHGYTINDAFKKFNETVDHFYNAGYKKLTVVTGHGDINKEMTTWAENNIHFRICERMDPNKGSFIITLNMNKVIAKPATTEMVDLTLLLTKFNSYRH